MSQLAIPPTELMQICLELDRFMANMEAEWKENSEELSQQFYVWRETKYTQWQQLLDKANNCIRNFPKEIRNRSMMKNLTAQIRHYKAEAGHIMEHKKERFEASFEQLKQEAEILYTRFKDIENHPLIQKFLEGKKILASRANLQWSRKLYHVFNGLFGLWLYAYSGLNTNMVIGILTSYFTLAIGVEIARRHSPTFNTWICKALGSMMREREKDKISSATWLMFSVLTILVVFPKEVNILPILFVAVGDPVAGIIGSLWGKTKLAPHVSLEGCLAFFTISFVMSFYFVGSGLVGFSLTGMSLLSFSFFAALVGTLSESLFKKFDDNLTIPLVSAPCLWLLIKIFH